MLSPICASLFNWDSICYGNYSFLSCDTTFHFHHQNSKNFHQVNSMSQTEILAHFGLFVDRSQSLFYFVNITVKLARLPICRKFMLFLVYFYRPKS